MFVFTVVCLYVGVLKSYLKASGSVTSDLMAERDRQALWQVEEQNKAGSRRELEALALLFMYEHKVL